MWDDTLARIHESTSFGRKRQWLPIRKAGISPVTAIRVTVLGWTLKKSATSSVVQGLSAEFISLLQNAFKCAKIRKLFVDVNLGPAEGY